jgi:hypothetical protein
VTNQDNELRLPDRPVRVAVAAVEVCGRSLGTHGDNADLKRVCHAAARRVMIESSGVWRLSEIILSLSPATARRLTRLPETAAAGSMATDWLAIGDDAVLFPTPLYGLKVRVSEDVPDNEARFISPKYKHFFVQVAVTGLFAGGV